MSTTTPATNSEQTDLEEIEKAVKQLQDVPFAGDARQVLDLLKPCAGENWLQLEIRHYPFAAKLYEDRYWLTDKGKVEPPGTTHLGIVLDKTLEVSVIETLDENRVYHRPMAILSKGSLFGSFEAADLMSQTIPLQNYTLFSGIRTFFFGDSCLDSHTSEAAYQNALKKALNNAELLKSWTQKDTFSPTQTPLCLLQAVLKAKISNWQSEVLMITLGSEFFQKTSNELKELIFRTAWQQSNHLRKQAIQAYSTDRIVSILRDETVGKKVGEEHRFAIARELSTLPAILAEGRPGFRRLTASSEKDHSGAFGPFNEFFQQLEELGKFKDDQPPVGFKPGDTTQIRRKPEKSIFIASYLFDADEPLVMPIWPNFDPNCENAGATVDNKGPGILKIVKPKWPKLEAEMLQNDSHYRRPLIELVAPENPSGAACFLRGYASIKTTAPKLPLFDAVPRLENQTKAVALVGIQHLMEETLCLVETLIDRGIVNAENIWLMGKPYSSSERVVHRLKLLGVHAEVPTWRTDRPGEFDQWFKECATDFFERVLGSLSVSNRISAGPIVILDDGGSLMSVASAHSVSGVKFRGVEQTSRGIAAASKAQFPVVLVACSALKSIVEPEFVARAAISKIARYYPEALRAKSVGVIGLGSLGEYFAKYLVARNDIRQQVVAYDPKNGIRTSGHAYNLASSASDVFKNAEVVFGCSGASLAFDESDNRHKAGQLMISLSSGDIEFSNLLRGARTDGRSPMKPISVGDRIITNGGFPITFDRSCVSAPLVEMQLTRALLLAAIQEVLAMDKKTGPQALSVNNQRLIWKAWKEHALNDTGEPALRSWRDQRKRELADTDLGSSLLDVAERVGSEADFEYKNAQFFELALDRVRAAVTSAPRGSNKQAWAVGTFRPPSF